MSRDRHKGARPIDHAQFYMPFGPGHPVERAIRTGSRWFDAWQMQHALPYARLTRASGIDLLRLTELSVGYPVKESEVAALATAYGVQPSDIIASLPDPDMLIRGK
jgi:hypothetical protein